MNLARAASQGVQPPVPRRPTVSCCLSSGDFLDAAAPQETATPPHEAATAPRAGGPRAELPVASWRMKRAFGLALGAAMIVAACGSVDVSSGQPSKSPPSPSTAATVAAETASPAPTPPSSEVLPTDALPSPSPSQDVASGAAGCSGSAGNRDFFAAVAEAVTWSVYCAVVPDGWFLESGNYRLRAGGQMTVAYRGPGGLHLELREGAFCNDANGCVPDGQATGPAPFGDLAGTLYVLSGGGLAVVVDRGETISWLAIGGNLDEPTFRSLTAALHRVD